MSKPLFTVTRRGEFKASFVADGQCGKKGTKHFNYEVVATGTKLNDAGILFEHFDVDDKIQSTFTKGKWKGSCELVAGKILDLVTDIDPDLETVTVTLKPGGENSIADITISWKHSDHHSSYAVAKTEEQAKAEAEAEEYTPSTSGRSC